MTNSGTMEVEEATKDFKNSTAKIIVIACVFVSCLAVYICHVYMILQAVRCQNRFLTVARHQRRVAGRLETEDFKETSSSPNDAMSDKDQPVSASNVCRLATFLSEDTLVLVDHGRADMQALFDDDNGDYNHSNYRWVPFHS